MGFNFNFFGKREVRRFNYRPRFYDPDEEERRQKFGDHSTEKHEYVPGETIRGSLRDGNHKDSKEVTKNQKFLGMFTVVMLFAVVACLFKYFPVLLDAYESEWSPENVYQNFYEEHQYCPYSSIEKKAYREFWEKEEMSYVELEDAYEEFMNKYSLSPFTFVEQEEFYMGYWEKNGLSPLASVSLQSIYDEFWYEIEEKIWSGQELPSFTSTIDGETVMISMEIAEANSGYIFTCMSCNKHEKLSVDQYEITEW